ncbi:tetratricopeptide repeat protein [Hyphomonas sp. FCG-A18]|uniref:tetratricopeptide repeat protein n=1 Tax=Hyphomonas sp. FCG-A18 TaxID=3080019 RepID=UPI002B2B5C54|nr:tetratricopeptide repeat protein [Hyphomonas sp. FCG-A18]
MIVRIAAFLTASLALTLPALAQFGPPRDTPPTQREIYADRALATGMRFSTGLARDVVTADDGVDLDRTEFWFDEALGAYTELCSDKTAPRDFWARNCYKLGDMYRRGLGTPQDYASAEMHFLAACEQGKHIEACLQQAHIDHTGNAGETDWPRARKLYSQACSAKEPSGCAGLGNMLYRGQGGFPDRKRGARLLQDACAADYEWACERIVGYGLTEKPKGF